MTISYFLCGFHIAEGMTKNDILNLGRNITCVKDIDVVIFNDIITSNWNKHLFREVIACNMRSLR